MHVSLRGCEQLHRPTGRLLTLMTRLSSSTLILGDTWISNAPPLWRPSGPTVAPYSESLC